MRTQYENDPVVRTIRRLLDGNGGKWEGTAGQLLKAGADLGFGRIAPTAHRLGFMLRELVPKFKQYDDVEYSFHARGSGGKLHCFRANGNWEEISEIELPF